MSDYLQRLLQRSQVAPLRRLPTPVVAASPSVSGESDSASDPFDEASASGTVHDERTAPVASATLRAQDVARPARVPGKLALGRVEMQALAPRESSPAALPTGRSPAGTPSPRAMSLQSEQPEQAARDRFVHDHGREDQPLTENERTAPTSLQPHQSAPIAVDAEGLAAAQDFKGAIVQPVQPETAVARTDFAADLQTLLRRLQGATAPESAAETPRTGDGQARPLDNAAPDAVQTLAPAPAPPPTVERRQLSIGRLVVEVTPGPPPTPAPQARPAPRAYPAAPAQTDVTSKLRFGIGQL